MHRWGSAELPVRRSGTSQTGHIRPVSVHGVKVELPHESSSGGRAKANTRKLTCGLSPCCVLARTAFVCLRPGQKPKSYSTMGGGWLICLDADLRQTMAAMCETTNGTINGKQTI